MSTNGRSSRSGKLADTGLVGYEVLAARFARLAAADSLTHAYCFTGDRGIGKATFAESLATYLEQGSFRASAAPLVDRTVIQPSETGTIGIDAVRDIRRFLWETPFRSPRRIAIIDGAEALTPEAQGALLKIVEEPPSHALLILVTEQADLLTPPLRSRLSTVYMPRLSATRIEELLTDKRGLSKAAAAAIAARSFGSAGRAFALVGGTPVAGEPNAADEIERLLVEAHAKRFKGYAPGRLAWLTKRLELVRRYNVNQPLQRRALEEGGVHEKP